MPFLACEQKNEALSCFPFSCSLPPSVLKNESVPFKIMEGTRIYNSCYVYKNFNSSSGQHVSCPNGWDFKHESRESSIGSEVRTITLQGS